MGCGATKRGEANITDPARSEKGAEENKPQSKSVTKEDVKEKDSKAGKEEKKSGNIAVTEKEKVAAAPPNNEKSKMEEKKNDEKKSKPLLAEKDIIGKHPLEVIDKKNVEELLAKAPDRTKTTLAALCENLKQHQLIEEEKAWMAFRWMSLNIAYDAKGYFAGSKVDCTPEGAFTAGKSVCSGYSRLFAHICKEIGVEVVCVNGYAKGVGYNPEVKEEKTNHEWNAVNLHKKWYLIDSTWGAGHIENMEFMKEYNEHYFCPDPKVLIRSHFPVEAKWQLIEPGMKREEAEELVPYEGLFFSAGFTSSVPDKAIIKAIGKTQIKLKFDPKRHPEISAQLVLFVDKVPNEVFNAVFIQKYPDYFEIDVALWREGKYDLKLYASKGVKNSYSSICTFRILCSENSKTIMKFPFQFPAYHELNSVLHQPKEGLLNIDTVLKFKIAVPSAEKVSVLVGPTWYHLKDTNNDHVFEGDAQIQYNELSILAQVKGQADYSSILKYMVKAEKLPDNIPVKKDQDVVERNGIKGFPKEGRLTANEKGLCELKLFFSEKAKTKFMATLNDGAGSAVEGHTLVQHDKGFVNIDASVPDESEYIFQIFAHGQDDPDEGFNFALEYLVKGNPKCCGKPFFRPSGQFKELNGYIFEPKSGTLKVGEKVSFRVRIKNIDEVFLVPKKGKKIVLNKETAEIFVSNGPVEITGKESMTMYGTVKGSTAQKGLAEFELEE